MKKDLNNWVIKSQEVYEEKIETMERTSLSKVLHSFIRLLSGVKMFYVVVPDVKTYIVYRKNKQEDTK